jgi:DNA modification methylase
MYRIEQADCFEWLKHCPGHSLHAVCTDPPYGILEFTEKELAKLRAGRGGVWRLPPKVGGSHRDPLPRFTVLTDE